MLKYATIVCFFMINWLAIINNAYAIDQSQKDLAGCAWPVAKKIRYGNIPVVLLQGNYKQMGIQYGQLLHDELQQSLLILKNYYITQQGIPWEKMIAQGELLYERFPFNFQIFIQGIAEGANIGIEEVKILNAMETMISLVSDNNVGHCAFLSISSKKTTTNSTLIGRNYDYPAPFNVISKYLTVTILKADNTEPVAIVSLPGQIYCPSCIGYNGLFMELNNGTPSGGVYND